MTYQKYVCIDLDGTIAHYDKWINEETFGEPVEGAQAALGRIRAAGWRIIIFTTRADKGLVARYLADHGIPFDHINENPDQPDNARGGKPFADAYVDDRGVPFNGDWEATADEVLRFVPWEKRQKATLEDSYQKEAVAFLGRDFGEAFNQLRAYDIQIWEVLKYSFGELLASIAAAWAIFAFANGGTPPQSDIERSLWRPVDATILLVSFLFGLLALQLILRNRVYFATAARYINEQRNFFLSGAPLGFKNLTHYYTDYSLPKPYASSSSQIIYMYVIASIDSILLGISAGLYANYFGLAGNPSLIVGLVAGLAGLGGTIGYSLNYLNEKKNEKPDPGSYGQIDQKPK